MSNPAPQQADIIEDDEEVKDPLHSGPPDEEFWDKYSKHLEFPLSTVAAILLHVVVGAFVVFVLFRLANQNTDRTSVPLKLVEGGFDDEGEGSAGSGGIDKPIAEGDHNPFKKAISDILPLDKLPEAKADIKDFLQQFNEGDIPVSAEAAAALSTLDKELKKKLLGAQRGDGNEEGRGYDGTKGKGPGGTGADSTRARTMRWVLRFSTKDGYDYVDQIAAMGGTIIVPIPPENKDVMYFPDVKNPGSKRVATGADWAVIGKSLKFSDGRVDSVANVAGALKLTEFKPKVFWAVFPKNIEEELDRKERGYRNRNPADIEETIFRIRVRGGGYDIVVDDQVMKR